MSKIANLVLNEKTKKWEAIFNGEVIVRSPDRKYVVNVITKGLNMKARTLGITDVQELGAATAELPAHEEPKVTFGVNERFQFLEDYVDMVANFQRKSVIVTGEGGLGKSHTVMRQLKLNGMRDFSELPVGTITGNDHRLPLEVCDHVNVVFKELEPFIDTKRHLRFFVSRELSRSSTKLLNVGNAKRPGLHVQTLRDDVHNILSIWRSNDDFTVEDGFPLLGFFVQDQICNFGHRVLPVFLSM
jgi:hypothetical protein